LVERKTVYLDGNIELGWFRMGIGVPSDQAVHPQLGLISMQTFRIAPCARVKDATYFRGLFHRGYRRNWARGDWFRNLDIVEAMKAFDRLKEN
jgi:hypothetical protein